MAELWGSGSVGDGPLCSWPRRPVGEGPCHDLRSVKELCFLHDVIEITPRQALAGRHGPARIQQLGGAPLADDARQDRAGAHVAARQAHPREQEGHRDVDDGGEAQFRRTRALVPTRTVQLFISLLLPFLPMLPTQILLNNILYDLSELPIPFDAVDVQDIAQPRTMDMGLIQRFMFTIGPVSSLFDLLTFYVMLHLFAANEALFRTGWFVESLATQVLVIFVIRTRRPLFDSRPAAGLVAMSLGVVLLGMWLPFSPLAGVFGFVALPAAYFGLLAVMVALYLLLVEWSKRVFFRRLNGHMARR